MNRIVGEEAEASGEWVEKNTLKDANDVNNSVWKGCGGSYFCVSFETQRPRVLRVPNPHGMEAHCPVYSPPVFCWRQKGAQNNVRIQRLLSALCHRETMRLEDICRPTGLKRIFVFLWEDTFSMLGGRIFPGR